MASDRIRVLFVVPTLQGGGAERVFVHLMRHIDRTMFEPVLAIGALEGPYVDDIPPDVDVHELRAPRARTAVLPLIRAARLVEPDIVFSTLGLGIAAALARPFLPSKTVVVTRLGNSVSAYLRDVAREGQIKKLAYTLATSVLLLGAHRLVAQSDFMVRDARAASLSPIREDKFTRIYNPVDSERISELAADGDPLFSHRVPHRVPHLVSVGKLEWQKGFDVLLGAFSRVVENHPEVTLTILGEGEERARLEGMVQDLDLGDRVGLPGFVENPFPYVRSADLFVLPSRYEGFSNALLEALALGTPVVATDCPGGNQEVVEPGVNGWLARSEDPASLASVISAGLTDGTSLDSSEIARNTAERFGVRRICGEYQRLFHSLV